MTIKTLLPEAESASEKLAGWLERRKDIKQRFLENIGAPASPRNTRLIETIEMVETEHYVRHRLRYVVGDEEEIPAYLLVPRVVKERYPAILAMHQMNDFGKDEVVGLFGNKNYAYGDELASRGYVVLAPDYLTFGERVFPGKEKFDSMPFYERHPKWSMVGKDIEDSMAAIDVLHTFGYVDKSRIGVIGHSHGGSNSIFAMALDERISVGVSNCGMSVISEEEKCLEWSAEDEYIYFPTLRKYLLEGKDLPFDINEVAALIAPRPWCNISAYYDQTLGNQEFLAKVGVQFNQVYEIYGKQSHFCYMMHGNDHSFPKFARSLAYEWLDRFLI
ncbi:MAG: dienelactone hydrolase family protein [Anaerolineales bacterium]|nr:dienelactone hydrolase family protein [Anaerolineales bacterium]